MLAVGEKIWLDDSKRSAATSLWAYLDPAMLAGLMATSSRWIYSSKSRSTVCAETWARCIKAWVPRVLTRRENWLGWLCRCVRCGRWPRVPLEAEIAAFVLSNGVRLLPFGDKEAVVGVVGSCALLMYLADEAKWAVPIADVVLLCRETSWDRPAKLRRDWQGAMIESVFKSTPTELNAIELDGACFASSASFRVRDVVRVDWIVRTIGRPLLCGQPFNIPTFRFIDVIFDDTNTPLSLGPVLDSFDIDVRALALVGPGQVQLRDDVKAAIAKRRASIRRDNVDLNTRNRLLVYQARGFDFSREDEVAVAYYHDMFSGL